MKFLGLKIKSPSECTNMTFNGHCRIDESVMCEDELNFPERCPLDEVI